VTDEDDDMDVAPAPTKATVATDPRQITPEMAAIAARFVQGQQLASKVAAGAVASTVADDDDGDEPDAEIAEAAAAPKAKVEPKPKAKAEPEAAPADAEADGDLDLDDEHIERMAGGPDAVGKPTRKDALRADLAARGLPEALIKTLVSHGKTKELEAWLRTPVVLPSQTDSTRQPSALPAVAPAPAPTVARQEPGLRDALAGVKAALESSGLLEKREADSLTGVLAQIVERQDRIEAAAYESQATVGREKFRSELRAAREGLAGQFPQVLDNAVYRDRVAPVLEALVTSTATGGRPLAVNLAAACRAALAETTDADRASRTLERSEGSRRQATAPRTRARAAETISPAELAGNLLQLRMQGGGSREDMIEMAKRFEGRVRKG